MCFSHRFFSTPHAVLVVNLETNSVRLAWTTWQIRQCRRFLTTSWMSLHASKQNLKVCHLTAEADPFCFSGTARRALFLAVYCKANYRRNKHSACENHFTWIYFLIYSSSSSTFAKVFRLLSPRHFLGLRTHPGSATDRSGTFALTLESIIWRVFKSFAWLPIAGCDRTSP